MNSAHRLATTRSEGRRLGERFRQRLRTSSWCLTSTDSATTERAPPGPASRATVTSRCRNRTARSRTAESYQDRRAKNAHEFGIRHGRPHNSIKIVTSSETLTNFAIRHAQLQPICQEAREFADA